MYLTPIGSQDVEGRVGKGIVALDGLLLSRTDSTIALSVNAVQRKDSDEQAWAGERVEVPARDIDHVAVRELDKARSVVAVIVAAGGALLLQSLIRGNEPAVTGTGSGGTPTGQ